MNEPLSQTLDSEDILNTGECYFDAHDNLIWEELEDGISAEFIESDVIEDSEIQSQLLKYYEQEKLLKRKKEVDSLIELAKKKPWIAKEKMLTDHHERASALMQMMEEAKKSFNEKTTKLHKVIILRGSTYENRLMCAIQLLKQIQPSSGKRWIKITETINSRNIERIKVMLNNNNLILINVDPSVKFNCKYVVCVFDTQSHDGKESDATYHVPNNNESVEEIMKILSNLQIT